MPGLPCTLARYWDLLQVCYPGPRQFFFNILCSWVKILRTFVSFLRLIFVMAGVQVKEGEYTTTIYAMVSDFYVEFIVLK